MHLFLIHPVPMAHYKIVHCFCIEYTFVFSHFSPQILSFFSSRKAWNSTPSFMFMTPGREITQKSMKAQNSSISSPPKEMKFGTHQIICDPGPVNWQNSMQNDANFYTFQHLHSVIPLKSMKTSTPRNSIFPEFCTICTKSTSFQDHKQCT